MFAVSDESAETSELAHRFEIVSEEVMLLEIEISESTVYREHP